ncbi:MAG: LAGLIDADG family homing endonuclease [Candidatus Hadarchaeum sp.]|uniref:LAGLIDADG family homing endonuclease n=1 Tax=Candidatus Hadarchaeum sp. TaxID=2883567 RepID=UPI003D0FED81
MYFAKSSLQRCFFAWCFAAEGSVILKKSGIIYHINFSSKDEEFIQFLKQCLSLVGVEANSYSIKGMNLQVYGLPNFRQFYIFNIHALHPEKREKFENGFASYKRKVLDGD